MTNQIYAIQDKATTQITYEVDLSRLHNDYKTMRHENTGVVSTISYEQFAADVMTASMQELLNVEIKPVPDSHLKELVTAHSESVAKARHLKEIIDRLTLQALNNPSLSEEEVDEIIKTAGSPAKKYYALAKNDLELFPEDIRLALCDLKHAAIRKTITLKTKNLKDLTEAEAQKVHRETTKLNDEIDEDLEFENNLVDQAKVQKQAS